MDFQERMSNTAYQRQMEDMRKAGLNPIFAGGMGGSSTPPGASIPMGDMGPPMAQTAHRAQQISQSRKQEQLLQVQMGATQAAGLASRAAAARSLAEATRIQNMMPQSEAWGGLWRDMGPGARAVGGAIKQPFSAIDRAKNTIQNLTDSIANPYFLNTPTTNRRLRENNIFQKKTFRKMKFQKKRK